MQSLLSVGVVVILTLTIVIGSFPLIAQERCSTMEFEKYLHQINPKRESTQQFESWIRKRKSEINLRALTNRTSATVYTLPVVVHVIHQGEAIGIGSNITDAQIQSQIDVLNEDFRRLNADASETLVEFMPVADDMEIEFVLAKQDPEGLASNGIVRQLADRSAYGINNALDLSNLSYWPAEDYINIWVTTLGSNLLGFTQFPVSDLPGLEEAPNNRLIDGLVIRYQSFGSIEKGNFPQIQEPFHLGRSTIHEMGHFMGLRHIWGDGNCNVDDFCDDTPTASADHQGCNLNRESCGQLSMVQNYMDYTDDVCMNIFTTNQKERMRIVMDNSPRRTSLITSIGSQAPVIVADDLGIKRILDPNSGQCSENFNPVIEVRNYGNNAVTSAKITMISNGVVMETIDLIDNLDPLELDSITFFPPTNLTNGSNELEFQITETNGTTDNNNSNDNKTIVYSMFEASGTSFSESFDELPGNWVISNEGGGITWDLIDVDGFSNSDNSALGLLHFNYNNGLGQIDRLVSPVKDFSNASNALLSFRYAYTTRTGKADRLTVAVSSDCGNSFPDVIFNEAGEDLATANSTSSFFTPNGRFEWRTISINLNDFLGQDRIQIAFIAQNGNGNNLFLDDIALEIENIEDYDLAIENILSPQLVGCGEEITPSIMVNNKGSQPINGFQASLTVNGNTQNIAVTETLNSMSSIPVIFDPVNLIEGKHDFDFNVDITSGEADKNISNNRHIQHHVFSSNTIQIPFRQQFEVESLEETGWSLLNPDNQITWDIREAPGNGINNKAAYMNAYNYDTFNAEDGLVSPIIDFSGTNVASMKFKYSYASINNFEDRLEIYASDDCSNPYKFLIYVNPGSNLGLLSTTDEWTPVNESGWATEFISLNSYAGREQVRITFLFKNRYGNNFYLDDIEFFLTSNENIPVPETNSVIVYPNPLIGESFNVTFNLEQNEDILIALIDSQGRSVFRKTMPNTLNQTYTFEVPNLNDGIYILKAIGDTFNDHRRIILHH